METQTAPILDTPEAAAFLRVSARSLEGWRVSGTGPRFVKAGTRVFYRLAALEAWLEDQERDSTSPKGGKKKTNGSPQLSIARPETQSSQSVTRSSSRGWSTSRTPRRGGRVNESGHACPVCAQPGATRTTTSDGLLISCSQCSLNDAGPDEVTRRIEQRTATTVRKDKKPSQATMLVELRASATRWASRITMSPMQSRRLDLGSLAYSVAVARAFARRWPPPITISPAPHRRAPLFRTHSRRSRDSPAARDPRCSSICGWRRPTARSGSTSDARTACASRSGAMGGHRRRSPPCCSSARR